jgi:hypothetical protein
MIAKLIIAPLEKTVKIAIFLPLSLILQCYGKSRNKNLPGNLLDFDNFVKFPISVCFMQYPGQTSFDFVEFRLWKEKGVSLYNSITQRKTNSGCLSQNRAETFRF